MKVTESTHDDTAQDAADDAIVLKKITTVIKPHFWSATTTSLRDVSLQVKRGEIFGFLGPNGAGKTTTIRTLLGLMKPLNGSVSVLGGVMSDPAIRSQVGFMPERAYFPGYLSALELVRQHALLAGMNWRTSRSAALRALERVGLLKASDRKMEHYSKGMLQRAGMAQAIVADPSLIVLDEPLSGLDPLGRKDMRDIMRELRNEGKTVFFSTHILPDVELICDRVAMLIEGTIHTTGTVYELTHQGTHGDRAKTSNPFEVTTESIDSAALQILLKSIPNITATTRHNHTLLSCPNKESCNNVIDVLRQHAIQIIRIEPTSYSLEDIFLAQTSPASKGATGENNVRGKTETLT